MCELEVADAGDVTAEELTFNSGLAKQDLSTLDPAKLTLLTPEVISRQATLNIGTIGHVAHGKSTVVKAVSGVRTTKFKREAIQNITIKLGYANTKVYKCPKCPRPSCYHAFGSAQGDKTECPNCTAMMELMRHISFVDCPGHEVLMATMLNGAAIMDAALLLIAANEHFPQPQTVEHLCAVEIMKLRHIVILQNKIDLVDERVAEEQYGLIQNFIRSTIARDSPIIPVSAQLNYNVDVVLEYLCNTQYVPFPMRDFTSATKMIIIRSFDVNKPGSPIEQLKGGVAGGTIQRGVLKVGQTIEVRPGLVKKSADGQSAQPIRTTALTLNSEKNGLEYAVPGGLIGVGMKIDPALTRQNKLVGHVIGDVGTLPAIYSELEIGFYLQQTYVGAKQDSGKSGRVEKLKQDENLLLNIGSLTTGGRVLVVKEDLAKIVLTDPVCADVDDKVALSRRVDKKWRLIGWGSVRRGKEISN